MSVSIEIDRPCSSVHRSNTIAGARGDGVLGRGWIESEALFNDFQRHSMPPLRDPSGFLDTSSPPPNVPPLPAFYAGGTLMQRSPEPCTIDAPSKAVVTQRKDGIKAPKRASAPVTDCQALAPSFSAAQSLHTSGVRYSSKLSPSIEGHDARHLSQLSATSEEQLGSAVIQSATIGFPHPAQTVAPGNMARKLSRSGSRRKRPPPLASNDQRADDSEPDKNTIPFPDIDNATGTVSNLTRSPSDRRPARSKTDPLLLTNVAAQASSPSDLIGFIPIEPVSPAALKRSEATAEAALLDGTNPAHNSRARVNDIITAFPEPPLARALSRKRPRSAEDEAQPSQTTVGPGTTIDENQLSTTRERSRCLDSPRDVITDPLSDFDDFPAGPTILVREPTLRDVVGRHQARDSATSAISQLSVTSFVARLAGQGGQRPSSAVTFRSAKSAASKGPSPLRDGRAFTDTSSSSTLAQRGSCEHESP